MVIVRLALRLALCIINLEVKIMSCPLVLGLSILFIGSFLQGPAFDIPSLTQKASQEMPWRHFSWEMPIPVASKSSRIVPSLSRGIKRQPN